jgi:murein endopeptidase/LysM repeat protein
MTRWALALTLVALTGCAAPAAVMVGPAAPANPGAPPFPANPAASWPASPAVPGSSLTLVAGTPSGAPGLAADAGAPADGDLSTPEDDDDEIGGASTSPHPVTQRNPALALSDVEIDQRFHHDPASLGPASIGPAGAGALVNGVQMPKGEHWQLLDPGHAWGTQETVDALVLCIERVNERFPGAPPLAIGHLSARTGGHLSPHKSHQSGRDADIGYYYKSGTRPFVRASGDNLDLARTWTLVKTAVRETTIDMIFIDRGVQRILADYAAANGEDAAFLDEVFQIRGKNARAPIRHIKGHDNHIHFRFHNPNAEEMGKRVARFVVIQRAPVAVAARGGGHAAESSGQAAQLEPAGYAQIRARSGDTLVILARRYGTTVEDIQRANRLSGNAIRAGFVYKIPQKVAPPSPRPKAPARVAQRHPQAKPAARGGGGLHTPRPAPAGTKPAAAAPEQ